MRDDTDRWDIPGSVNYAVDGLTIAEVQLPCQHWVSGQKVLQHFEAHLASWPDVVSAKRYALALRRDRVLVIGSTDLVPGFSEETGFAISDVSDAYQVIDISGSHALNRLRRGAELDLSRQSPSAMRRVFGIDVVLYRFGEDTRYRMHVPRAMLLPLFQRLIA